MRLCVGLGEARGACLLFTHFFSLLHYYIFFLSLMSLFLLLYNLREYLKIDHKEMSFELRYIGSRRAFKLGNENRAFHTEGSACIRDVGGRFYLVEQ